MTTTTIAPLRPLIGVINLSKKISNSDVKTMVMAVQQQIKDDVALQWGRDFCFIMFYEDPKTISARAYPVLICDDDTTPDVLGYHAERNGMPYGKVLVSPVLDNNGVVLFDPKNPQNTSVASILSHEVLEIFIDPYVNIWVDGAHTGYGSTYAMEICDPVESSLYNILVGKKLVSVSNFVLPQYFDINGVHEKYDHLGILNSAFSLAHNGYMIVRDEEGNQSQIFDEAKTPQWKLDMKKHKLSSRTTLRMPIKHKKWWKYLF